MVARVTVAPELYRWAVERAGWDDEKVAEKFPAFESWLEGSKKPTLKQLEQFAHATHAPIGLLFLSEPPAVETPIPDFRTVKSAGVRRMSVDLLDTIYICQRRQDWYRDYLAREGAEPLPFVGKVTVEDDPKFVAHQINESLGFITDARSKCKTRDELRKALVERIEDLGVLVMINGVVGNDTHRPLDPEEFRGFALADAYAPLIFVNGADTKAAQIFTLIHELAHVWLGSTAVSDAALNPTSAHATEVWCNAVAAEVLVPIENLKKALHQTVNDAEIDRLAQQFKVSTLVILQRIFAAGAITREQLQLLYRREHDRAAAFINSQSSNGGGNFYRTQPYKVSNQFARAVISSAYEGTTEFGEAYRLLGLKKHDTFVKLGRELGVGAGVSA